MIGTVEVFSVNGNKWEKVYEDNNLVVHGGRKALADIFTYVPAPSGVITSDFETYYAVSNFTVQSMTLGAGTNRMKYRDSRHGVISHNYRLGTQHLDVSGRTYSLLPYRENFNTDAIGAYGTKKNSAVDYSISQYVPLELENATIHEYGKVRITQDKDLDGGSITIEKVHGQDLAIIEMPVELDNATDYKFNLGIDGKLPVKLELVREDKITKRNALSVDLREQRWDFSQSQFVFVDEQASEDNLSKELFASSVPVGELTETLFSTAFDKIDQARRVERYTHIVRLTCPKATDFEKGSVRIFSPRLEVLNNLILKNPNFTRVESLVDNTSFKDLKPIDTTNMVSASPEQLKAGGVYQIGGWDHMSPMYASSNFTDLATSSDCQYGWISLENVDEFGTSATPPQTKDGNESNIGVAFNGRQLYWDSSSTAQLSKTFKYPGKWVDFYAQTGTRFESSSLLNDPYTCRSLVIKMDINPVSSVGSTKGTTGVGLRLENISKGLSYNFASGVGGFKGDWSPFGVSATMAYGYALGSNTTHQVNVNMPLEFANDMFKLDIIGHAGNADTQGKLVIRNLDIGQYEGWHVHEGITPSGVTNVSSMAGSPTSALYFVSANDIHDVDYRLASSIDQLTYISQTVSGLDPEKAYNLVIDSEATTDGITPAWGVALIHKGYSNPYNFDYARYLTVGLPQNAGNAFNKFFNPLTSVSGFTMYGPGGPPTDLYRDLNYKEHQRCVKWTNVSSLGADSSSLMYKFISSGTGEENKNHYHVNLPDGNFNMSMGLRHVFDDSVSPSFGFYDPVGTRLRVAIPGSTTDAYYYDFYRRKFIRVDETDTDLTDERWTYKIMPGSHGPEEFAHENYPIKAKTPTEILNAGGDPEGWHDASFYFDVKSSDFTSDVKRTADTEENNIHHTSWGTRKVEFIFTQVQSWFTAADEVRGAIPHADYNGTVYIKDFSIKGPPPPREQPNTYFVYQGEGVWNPTSSLNCCAYDEVLGTGPITGARPSKMVTSGIETWNPLLHGDGNRKGFTFSQQNANGKSKSIPIFGMSALGNVFGTSSLASTGETFPNNHDWSASKDSIYELILFYAKGDPLKLNGVYLVDAALTHYGGTTLEKYADRNRLTSQADVSTVSLRHAGGWSTQFVKTQTAANTYTTDYPKIISYVSSTPNRDAYHIGIQKESATSYTKYHTANLCYFDTVENWGLMPGRMHAFSFDYAATGIDADVGIFMEYDDSLFFLSGIDRAQYNSNGVPQFPLTKWVPHDRNKGSVYLRDTAFADLEAHNIEWKGSHTSLTCNYLTNEFLLPTRVPKDARIGVMIKNTTAAAAYNALYTNMRAYVCGAQGVVAADGTVSDGEVNVKMPDFPGEQDVYVQEPTDASTPGEYGHFQNAIEFKADMLGDIAAAKLPWTNQYHSSAVTHIPTEEKAIHRGAYLPASGLIVSAGAFGYPAGAGTYGGWGKTDTSSLSGTLNLYSVVTPKGHILNNFSAININDSSAGMVVSGPIAAVSAAGDCVVKYALSLSSNEAHYLNFYGGGIESAGLWTVDWARSAAKQSFVGDRKPPFLVSSIGVPYAQSIYNLKDYEEPEWNLFAKKVFMAGGLKPQKTSGYLTIVWSLKF